MVLLGNPPLFQQEDKSKKVRKGVVITFIESSNMGLNFVFGLHYLNCQKYTFTDCFFGDFVLIFIAVIFPLWSSVLLSFEPPNWL